MKQLLFYALYIFVAVHYHPVNSFVQSSKRIASIVRTSDICRTSRGLLVCHSSPAVSDEVVPTFSMNLPSAMGVDYVPLATMLSMGDFKAADQFTRDVLIRLVGAEAGRKFVFWTEVKNIPSTDLATIERLWLTHSDGKFGYSVQKRIWAQEGGNFPRFIRRIGWTIDTTAQASEQAVSLGSDEYADSLTPSKTKAPPPVQDKPASSDGAYLRAGEERMRKWFGTSEFVYDLDAAPRGHLPLTNALRGTQLLKHLLQHPVWDLHDWQNYQTIQ